MKPDFSPIKAISAFEGIEKYATNILNFPWRHEFQTIYSFSGYFRVIENTLFGVRPIFELLGFAFDASTSVFKLIEVPIDPDKVSKIALECLVAIGECKMMLSIYNLAKKDFPNLTWSDIHSIRTDNICNIEGALKLLNDLKTTRLIDLDLPDYSMKKINKLDLLSPPNGVSRPLFDSCSSNNNHILPPPASYLESNLDSFEFIDSKSEELVSPISPQSTSSSFHTNRQPSSQLPQQPLPPPPSFMSVLEPARSPTAKAPMKENLPMPSSKIDSQSKNIDISSTTRAYNYDNSDNNADGKYQSTKKTVEKDGKKNNSIDPDRLLAEIHQFDQFNRKNGSSPTNSAPKSKNAFSVEKKPLKVAIGGDKGTSGGNGSGKTIVISAERGRTLNIINRYPKNAKQEVVPSLNQEPEETFVATATINTTGPTTSTSATPLTSSSLAPLKVKVANLPSSVVKLNGPSFASSWACKSCTYINQNGSEVCKMCHKSRSLGNESTPLVSGGRECSRCTLVNSKDDMFCNACNTSLADSPTYI